GDPLDGEDFDEHVDTGCRRAYVGLKWNGPERVRCRDRDHGSARCAQMLISRTASVEGAKQVDVDDGLEAIGRHSQRGSGEIPGCSAQQDIDFAVLLACLLKSATDGAVIANISRKSGSIPSGTPDTGDGSIEFF